VTARETVLGLVAVAGVLLRETGALLMEVGDLLDPQGAAPKTDRCPDTVPLWMDEEADL
jgi:hypothetical protein